MNEATFDYRYRAFGLNIHSQIEIPELYPADDWDADVHILTGGVPEILDDPKVVGVRFQAKPDLFLLKVDKIAGYLVSDGNRIIIDKFAEVEDKEVRLFLLGSAFGALFHQRGLLPLHASAIEVNQQCVLFCGDSGNGKSTIARCFLERGYHLQADDICVITIDKKGFPIVFPGYPQLKLWRDALVEIGEEPGNYLQVRSVLDKYAVPVKDRFHCRALPIKKLYVLSPYNGDDIEISTINGIEKFNTLKNHTYRFRFVEGLNKEKVHFKNAGAIGNLVPFRLVKRPQEPFLLSQLADSLEKDFLA